MIGQDTTTGPLAMGSPGSPLHSLVELSTTDGAALWSRYMELCARCRETQSRFLDELVRANAASDFGRAHRFDRISSTSEYRRAVPISTWSRIAPRVDELLRSGGDVLTSNDPVLRYNLTSGTSGKPKLVPLTARGRLANAITLKLRISSAVHDHPAALRGGILPFAYQSVRGRTPLDIPYGSPASATVTSVPAEVARTLAYPPTVLEIPDSNARKYAMLRFALGHSPSAAAGNNPLSFVKLFEFAREHRTQLVEDVRRGTLTLPTDLPERAQRELAAHLRPAPERASFLDRIAGADFVPRTIWPDLRLFFCWKTGVMGSSIPELIAHCAEGTVVREFGYGASEGLFTIPLGDESSEGVLAVHGIFFEFLPEGEAPAPEAETLLAHELVPGRRYQLVLTNCSGLYRYAIDDIVEVTGFLGEAPKIVFVRRAGDVVNMVGEKIEISQVVAALQRAQAETGLGIRHFQWVADKVGLRYELCVEPLDDLDDDDRFRELLRRFEAALARAVRPYEVLREEGLLSAPRIRVMRRGWLLSILDDGKGGSTEVKPRVIGEGLAYPHFSEKLLQ